MQARGPASSNTASQAFSLHNSSWKAKQVATDPTLLFWPAAANLVPLQ
jgi:hypothetical protein